MFVCQYVLLKKILPVKKKWKPPLAAGQMFREVFCLSLAVRHMPARAKAEAVFFAVFLDSYEV